MLLKVDLHTHTSRYSPCSVLSPERLCEIAIQRGLNALAITEHRHQWSKQEIGDLQAQFPTLKLYAGVEISCDDGHDYVALGLDAGPHSPQRMPYAQLRSLMDEHPGAFVFLAHLFRHSGNDDGLTERSVDGIEVASYNILARPQPRSGPAVIKRSALYRKWQEKMGWIALYNSDGHSKWMVGTFYNQIETADGMPPDEEALIRLLRQSEIRGFQDDELIRESIGRWW